MPAAAERDHVTPATMPNKRSLLRQAPLPIASANVSLGMCERKGHATTAVSAKGHSKARPARLVKQRHSRTISTGARNTAKTFASADAASAASAIGGREHSASTNAASRKNTAIESL